MIWIDVFRSRNVEFLMPTSIFLFVSSCRFSCLLPVIFLFIMPVVMLKFAHFSCGFDHYIPQSIELYNETQQEAKKKYKKNKTKLHTTANVYNCLMNFSQNKAHATSTCKFQLTVRSDHCCFFLLLLFLFYSCIVSIWSWKFSMYDNFKRKTKTTTIINTIHQL